MARSTSPGDAARRAEPARSRRSRSHDSMLGCRWPSGGCGTHEERRRGGRIGDVSSSAERRAEPQPEPAVTIRLIRRMSTIPESDAVDARALMRRIGNRTDADSEILNGAVLAALCGELLGGGGGRSRASRRVGSAPTINSCRTYFTATRSRCGPAAGSLVNSRGAMSCSSAIPDDKLVALDERYAATQYSRKTALALVLGGYIRGPPRPGHGLARVLAQSSYGL